MLLSEMLVAKWLNISSNHELVFEFDDDLNLDSIEALIFSESPCFDDVPSDKTWSVKISYTIALNGYFFQVSCVSKC